MAEIEGNFVTQSVLQAPPQLSTRAQLLGIWRKLSQKRKLQLGGALVLMLASGFAEVGSLAAAVPFLAVLNDPERLWQMPLVRSAAVGFGITSAQRLLLPIAFAFGIAAVLAAAVRLFNLWFIGRLAAAIGSDLSSETYMRTLYQPYSVHVQRNSSRIINGIVNHLSSIITVLNATLQLVTSAIVALCIVGTLLAIDWIVACTAITVFCLAYGLLSFTVRRRLAINSSLNASAGDMQMKALQEGLGAIREVLLDGNQNTFLEIFRSADRPMRRRQAQNSFLTTFPRFGLEALGLILIAFLAVLLSLHRPGSLSLITLLGTLALGSQRLLPALQQMYGSWALMRSLGASVEQVLMMLNQPLPSQSSLVASQPLLINHAVRIEGLMFRYGREAPRVLDGIDLVINRGERVGLIGATGSGKSTLVDLLMGLLEPTSGKILIDGVDLNDPHHPERLVSWRSGIAHVSQNIFLSDNSIAENIAFGIPKHQIDLNRMRRAADQACISGFIESISNGYDTFVGERGIRLSGGQRQRIGIARALYKQASVLVLDEATSALDTTTEKEVMKAWDGLSRDLTIIMVAHRHSTLACCDKVIRLEHGLITSQGPPRLILTES